MPVEDTRYLFHRIAERQSPSPGDDDDDKDPENGDPPPDPDNGSTTGQNGD